MVRTTADAYMSLAFAPSTLILCYRFPSLKAQRICGGLLKISCLLCLLLGVFKSCSFVDLGELLIKVVLVVVLCWSDSNHYGGLYNLFN